MQEKEWSCRRGQLIARGLQMACDCSKDNHMFNFLDSKAVRANKASSTLVCKTDWLDGSSNNITFERDNAQNHHFLDPKKQSIT
jgi:hypothetical protein